MKNENNDFAEILFRITYDLLTFKLNTSENVFRLVLM